MKYSHQFVSKHYPKTIHSNQQQGIVQQFRTYVKFYVKEKLEAITTINNSKQHEAGVLSILEQLSSLLFG